ncbi:hypothetical protein [Streptomyces hundungensis]|uniref:hypothetical protein n=1 Tax=Streptomyces hundungensis TaxID=1077946 RepID=UPI001C1F9F0F|nr:hypothetical protein [Streptomyces hundungensis]
MGADVRAMGVRTAIHRGYEPGERFMTRYDISQRFDIGGKEAAAAVRQLIAEGLLTGPRGQYVNAFSPEHQRRRVKQLRERASQRGCSNRHPRRRPRRPAR